MTDEELLRYSRQILLPEFDIVGQECLGRSRALIVGLGGLGSAAAMYLAAAGVGRLILVDFDTVDLSNLQRQIVHRTADIGRPKVESARDTLRALNPLVEVVAVPKALDDTELLERVRQADVVVDASDNLATRYALNAACVAAGTPLVWASIVGFEGQVGVVTPGGGPCYACVFPTPPPPEFAPDCARAGVLGPACGIVGAIEAAEAVKLVVGMGDTLAGRLLMVDALGMTFTDVTTARRAGCAVCGGGDGRTGA